MCERPEHTFALVAPAMLKSLILALSYYFMGSTVSLLWYIVHIAVRMVRAHRWMKA